MSGAVAQRRHLAIVSATVFDDHNRAMEDTHFSAIVYEKLSDGTGSLYVYDPYRGFTLSSSMQNDLKAQGIKLYISDTPRSYALKGTSFAYAIQDIERLSGVSDAISYKTYVSEAGPPVFKLEKPFKYNGLEVKREYFQLMVDTVDEVSCDDTQALAVLNSA